MRLIRIYQQQALSTDQVIGLSRAAAHHLVGVRRATVGTEFILFNGSGGEFTAKIIRLEKESVSVQVGEHSSLHRESPLQITLGQAVVRPEKMDFILQKAVELGVTHIIPFLTERSLLKLSARRWEKRLIHWQAVIVAACEQSGRTQIPSISIPTPFRTAVKKIKVNSRAILMPNVAQTMQQFMVPTTHVAVLVGPEGGWSDAEAQFAGAAHYVPVQLGPRILRTETAGLVALTLLQGTLGDISSH